MRCSIVTLDREEFEKIMYLYLGFQVANVLFRVLRQIFMQLVEKRIRCLPPTNPFTVCHPHRLGAAE